MRSSHWWTLNARPSSSATRANHDGYVPPAVTSPPYWGKRDYRVVGQYGHEADPAAYVNTLQATGTEGRRVLADDGTCWLNLGDSYSAGGSATILDQSSELASLSAEVGRCTSKAVVVVTKLDAQRRLMAAVGSFSVREA